MSILSQIGILILIGCIIFILIRSNKTLEQAAEEGEHFVDEWALRQQKKEERKQEKAQRSLEKKQDKAQEWTADTDEDMAAEEEEKEELLPQTVQKEYADNEKIISMDHYKNPGILLVQLDEIHRPVNRIRVTKLPFTIGRSGENMLVLDDLCVARKHCRIVEKDGVFLLEDVGTANKIFAEGTITDHVVLRDQLTFYIGNVEFRVEMSGARSGYTHLYPGAGERYYE